MYDTNFHNSLTSFTGTCDKYATNLVLSHLGSRYSSRTDLTESTIQCEPKPRTNRSQSAGIFAPINYGGMHFFARAQTPEKDTVFSCIVCKQSIDGEKKQRFNDGCLEGVNEKWVHEDCMDSVCPVCNQVGRLIIF